MANKVLPVQMVGHLWRCLTKGSIISVTHYLPVQAHRLGHLFLCWGKYMKVALVEHGPTHILLEWLLTCISFRGWLFAMWVGVFFPHLLIELEVKCGGLAVPQRRSKAWEVHLLVVPSWVEVCQVFLSVSCGGPGLATHIQPHLVAGKRLLP